MAQLAYLQTSLISRPSVSFVQEKYIQEDFFFLPRECLPLVARGQANIRGIPRRRVQGNLGLRSITTWKTSFVHTISSSNDDTVNDWGCCRKRGRQQTGYEWTHLEERPRRFILLQKVLKSIHAFKSGKNQGTYSFQQIVKCKVKIKVIAFIGFIYPSIENRGGIPITRQSINF